MIGVECCHCVVWVILEVEVEVAHSLYIEGGSQHHLTQDAGLSQIPGMMMHTKERSLNTSANTHAHEQMGAQCIIQTAMDEQ